MTQLLALSRAIDRVTQAMGRLVAWAVVAAALVSATNAVLRKAFDISSNSWLELQWWLFGLVFLFAAPWTLKVGEHIRIDILHDTLAKSTRDWIDLLGTTFFLLPVTAVVLFTAWPFAWASMMGNEQSFNAGGLPQWPAKMMIPLAFTVLFIQGISQLIKRVAIIKGVIVDTDILKEETESVPLEAKKKSVMGD